MTPRRIVVGLLAAAVLVTGWILLSGGDDAYRVDVELPNAGGLRKHSSVKIAGVPGGTVADLEITDRDTAIAKLDLKSNSAPIGRGASVKIRPTDLLGERYVALDVGDRRRPLPSGSRIPLAKASLPVELDDVLNTFDEDTRTRVKILVNEFGVALGSRGKDLAKLLDAMPPSLDDARKLVSEVVAENRSLGALIERGDRITASIDPKKDDLAKLIDQADRTLKEVADRRQSLGRALDSAPAGLAELRRTLAQLRTTSTSLRPAAADLQRSAQPLRGTLAALPGFEDAARDSLKAANEAAPQLRKLGDQATAPLQRLRPTLAQLRQVSDLATPTLDELDRRAFEDILWFVQNWSLGLKNRDGLGHFIGAKVSVGTQTIRSVVDSLLGGGTEHGQPPDPADPPDPDLAADAAGATAAARAATPRKPLLRSVLDAASGVGRRVGGHGRGVDARRTAAERAARRAERRRAAARARATSAATAPKRAATRGLLNTWVGR
ncbi:MlaD family protein [Patulibacter medicamentivorans]|uniref:MlaD family protein n=1 Tax=Patulibacter medicamentivorans TaxID=1097667 RepID=UPI0002DEF70C|nr:MlaD family protein [Patulibacter medicamentivorans]